MNYTKLRKLKDRVYFGRNELENALSIQPASSAVVCSRYVKNGFLVRLKRDFYILNETWERLNLPGLFLIANILQVPSYISFMTALSYYEITTQIPRNFFESTCLKHSKKITIKNTSFNYYKLNRKFYFDFEKKDGFFIATKEKAFMDTLYLFSLGKYKFDLASLDLKKLDKDKLKSLTKRFPIKTQIIAKKLCRI